MIRKIYRTIRPNPLDKYLKNTVKKNGKNVLIAWNRGLGDIALGLYAIKKRIYSFIPDAKIYFLIRENLKEGITLLGGDHVIIAPFWKRGVVYDVIETLTKLNIDPKTFDLILEKPDPTYWVRWQLGKVTPKLQWNATYENYYQKFSLQKSTYIGVQPFTETNYGLWRNWTLDRWQELFEKMSDQKFLLFGYEKTENFSFPNVIDLRQKTSLFEVLSIIKNCCNSVILPDSGILSMIYYLEVDFPLKIVSFWGDHNQGILKQNVASPNPSLIHKPLIAKNKNLSIIQADEVIHNLGE